MKSCLWAIFATLMTILCLFACQRAKEAFPDSGQHEVITLDSTIAVSSDARLATYLDSLKQIYQAKMNGVIGQCHHTIDRERPQDELSNLLTDMVWAIGDSVSYATSATHIDFALLNFGGIRKPLHAGDITVGDIFSILPFDNEIVLSSIRGSDLRCVIEQMSDSTNQPFANVAIVFSENGTPTHIRVNQQPLQDDQIYRFASINFITDGGDNIFVQRDTQAQIPIGEVLKTNILIRDAALRYVQQLPVVRGYLDDRTTYAGRNL